MADNVVTLTLVNQLSARLAQLQALLAMPRSNTGAMFRRMGAEYQEHYLCFHLPPRTAPDPKRK